jgi:hypothetical protein
VGEKSGLNKTAAPNITENSQPFDLFLLYFQTILAVIVQETNQYMQQEAQTRNKPDITYSQKISVKNLYTFLAVIVQMCHNHKPDMILYWTKDELYHVPFYSSMVPLDHFLMILKYLYFADN